ncbi:hypothetical protein B0O99DRAFT_551996 [Bisporella sp. PMI_857]|nr:hypothetical protein B0O99DRAFT_551996 [Bisporella sp. PMI_857]
MSSHAPPSLGHSTSTLSNADPQAQPNHNANDPGITNLFPRLWRCSTTDNNLSLYGFRRFKTSHLLNLRFLEEEVAELDHKIYQAGLSLGLEPTPSDRLGLRHSKIDANAPRMDDTIHTELVLQLRSTMKEYDDALTSFSQIMAMETFSLLDDGQQASVRTDLSAYGIYKTRLVRVDVEPRRKQDPLQRLIHKFLRRFRYWRMSFRVDNIEDVSRSPATSHQWSYQNSANIAVIAGRILCSVAVTAFLVAPLIILSYQSSKKVQLVTISVFLVTLSLLVSVGMKTSNLETMAVSAAYAAVLSVFVSNGLGPTMR